MQTRIVLLIISLVSTFAIKNGATLNAQISRKFLFRNKFLEYEKKNHHSFRFTSISSNVKENEKKDEASTAKENPSAPKWITLIENLNLKGYDVYFLFGFTKFIDSGYIIETDQREQGLMNLLYEKSEVQAAMDGAKNMIREGLFYFFLGNGEEPNDEMLNEKINELDDSFHQADKMGQNGEAIPFHFFHNCEFSFVSSPLPELSTKRGIEGFIVGSQNYASSSCIISQINYHRLVTYPNTNEHPDIMHDPNSVEVLTNMCKKNKENLQNAVVDFLDKYKIVLEILELKHQKEAKEEELVLTVKKLGIQMDEWNQLWKVVGLESSNIAFWIKQVMDAVHSNDSSFSFSFPEKIKPLVIPKQTQ